MDRNEPAKIKFKLGSSAYVPYIHKFGTWLFFLNKAKGLISERDFGDFITADESITTREPFSRYLKTAFPEYTVPSAGTLKIDDVYNHVSNNISKLTIAKHIINNFIDIDKPDYLRAYITANIDRIKKNLIKNKLAPTPKLYTIEYTTAIIYRALFITGWVRPPVVPPKIRKGRCLLNLVEMLVITAIETFLKVENRVNAKEQITTIFDENVLRFIKPSMVKIDEINRIGHAIINDIKEDISTVDMSLLFIDDAGQDSVRHIASFSNNGPFIDGRISHHGIYIGNMYCTEAWPQKRDSTDKMGENYISVKSFKKFMDFARNGHSSLYIFDYTDKPSDSYLKTRALWALGKYSKYNLLTENCESYVNWVFENKGWDTSELCTIEKTVEDYIDNASVRTFWSNLLVGGYDTVNAFRSVGVNIKIFFYKNEVAAVKAKIAAEESILNEARQAEFNEIVQSRSNAFNPWIGAEAEEVEAWGGRRVTRVKRRTQKRRKTRRRSQSKD